MSNLKPCPLCDSGNIDIERPENLYIAICQDCDASGRLCDTLEEASNHWNTRVDPWYPSSEKPTEAQVKRNKKEFFVKRESESKSYNEDDVALFVDGAWYIHTSLCPVKIIAWMEIPEYTGGKGDSDAVL